MNWVKRMISVSIVIILFTVMGMSAYAIGIDEAGEMPLEEYRKTVYEMPVQSNETAGWPQAVGTYGEAAIVMEAGTGAVLYAKNIDDHHYPASITKLLTTLVAVENGEFGDRVTFSADSLSFLEPGDACIGMKEGNEISLEQALYAVLLASANEVSYAVGESVGKKAGHDYNWFIEQMNTRCRELGGANSNFVNTNGLHDDNHYTCARDMALIGCEIFKHPKILGIMKTLQFEIEASATTEEHVFQQNHRMLNPDTEYYYEYAVGGKTGYTDQAYTTLVTMADDGNMRLVCVVLRTRGADVYQDTRNLLDYAYANFTSAEVADYEKSEDIEQIYEEGNRYVMLPKEASFEDLEMEITPDEEMYGDAVLTYTYGGNCVGKVRAELSYSYLQKLSEAESSKEESSGAENSGEGRKKSKQDGKEKKAAEEKNSNIKTAVLTGATALLAVLTAAFVRLWLKRRREGKRRRR